MSENFFQGCAAGESWQAEKVDRKEDLSPVVVAHQWPALKRSMRSFSELEIRWGEQLAYRLRVSVSMIERSIDFDLDTMGGKPVVKGTRITVAQIFAEIANDRNLSDIADDMDLDESALVDIMQSVAIQLDCRLLR